MGDRVLMQVFSSKTNQFSPVLYCHWSGESTPNNVKALKRRMADRMGDVDYWAARMVQSMMGALNGSTGFGIWNSSHLLTAEDSHGDAGCVVIDCETGDVGCFGGYLKPEDFK